jgi:hypothetical protein
MMQSANPQTVLYLSKERFFENAEANAGGHWSNAEDRWRYHSRATDFVKAVGPSSPKAVLEMGTMGASLVVGSDTIDFDVNWPSNIEPPTYYHDARLIPWPIKDKQYECFVGLRVLQHLVPNQRECFIEAKRVAKNMILVVPTYYPDKILGKLPAGAVTLEQLVQWNDSVPPTEVVKFGNWIGNLYFWREKDLR